MDAPKTISEIFERKKRARNRFDDLSLLTKMQIAFDLYRSLQTVRNAQCLAETTHSSPKNAA